MSRSRMTCEKNEEAEKSIDLSSIDTFKHRQIDTCIHIKKLVPYEGNKLYDLAFIALLHS